jgi:uncharacterized protein YndB with AHSA1/START domain
MGRTRESIAIDLTPERAFELWTDVRRWSTFVEGFGHTERVDDGWPQAGAKVVWSSKPHGRGRVTEKVLESEPPHRLRTMVLEERLSGTQIVTFEADEAGETVLELELDYKLTTAGVLAGITDFLFIRRAVRDSLVRTLHRFAGEAAEDASL